MTQRFSTAALLAAFVLGIQGTNALAQDDAPAQPGTGTDAAAATGQGGAETDAPATDDASDAGGADDDGLFVDPGGAGEETPPATVEARDLVIGDTIEVEPGHAVFRFHAEEAGMLTLLTYLPDNEARVRLQLTDAEGRNIPGGVINGNAQGGNLGPRIVVDQFGNPQGTLPGLSYAAIPLPEAGDYRIELTVTGETESNVQVGGAWVAFEQVGAAAPAAPVVPPPPPPPPPAPFDPTEVATELATGETLELDIEDNVGWVKLVAEEPGTLVVVSRGGSNDVRLYAFRDGQFADARYTMNQNRGGQRGNEALMFHADAGDVWFIRLNTARDLPVPVRAALIPDDLEPAEEHEPADDE